MTRMFKVLQSNPFESEQACLIIGVKDLPKKFGGSLETLDGMLSGALTEMVKNGELSAKRNALTSVHTLGKLPVRRLLFVGLGKEKQLTFSLLKEAFGFAFKQIKEWKLSFAAIALDTFVTGAIPQVDAAFALSEAFPLSTYTFTGYKQQSNEPEKFIEQITVFTEAMPEEITKALHTGFVLGKATNSARTLVNTPGNLMTATDLAAYASKLADQYKFQLEILEKEEMEKLGMGAFLAVNKGSEQPPKMIVLSYQGKQEWQDVIGLVGKGVTFDTGGYSLKPKDGIVGMKTDMGGAAAVLGAMEAIGELRPEQNVIVVIPSTDNMISGAALKPDDVITSLSGKTIEVLNTDAEGRLVLADAMTYAKQHGANYLIDVATLTGGVIVALGTDKTGALTNHESLFEQVLEASFEADEFIWRLPYTEKDKKRIRNSRVADLNNSPGREGHAIMGGGFVGEFAEETPWVHLDIAGTAVQNSVTALGPAGATGVMVRTLALFVDAFEPIPSKK